MNKKNTIKWKLFTDDSCFINLFSKFGINPTHFCDSIGVRIKDGPHRTVWRCIGPWGDVHIKKNPLHNVRAFARRFLRPSKSEMEASNALKLKSKGINSLEILAVGEENNWCRTGWLVTKSITQAVPLDHVLSEAAPEKLIQIAKSLGNFIAKMHGFGVFHRDLHPGNLLIEENGNIHVLDIHDLSWKKASLRNRLKNLIILNRWFQIRTSPWDRTRFFKEYFRFWNESTGGVEYDYRAIIKILESKTYHSNHKLWRNRDSRCLSTNREFVSSCRVGFRINTIKEIPYSYSNALTCPFSLLPLSETLKKSESSTVALIQNQTNVLNVKAVIKFLPHTRFILDWIRSFWELPGKKAWRIGHAMMNRRLPTPCPIGYSFIGNLYRSEERLIIEFIPQALQLDEWFRKYSNQFEHLRNMAIYLGNLIHRMHLLGVRHRDLKAANILIDFYNKPLIIDLSGACLINQIPESIKLKDLARLARSAVITRMGLTHYLRFFKAYHRGQLTPQWKAKWRYISSIVGDALLRQQRNGRPLG